MRSSSDVAPYFNQLERDVDFGELTYHGDCGPIPVRRLATDGWGTIYLAFAEAAQAVGHPWEPDHNAPGATGVSPFAANIVSGCRVSTGEAYLQPGRQTGLLRIIGGAYVDRVLFDGKRAVDVLALIDASRLDTTLSRSFWHGEHH